MDARIQYIAIYLLSDLEAAAEEDAEEARHAAEHHAEAEPDVGVAGHPRHHSLGAGQWVDSR